MKTIQVKLGDNSYPIHIGSGLLAQIGPELKEKGFRGKLVIITNPIVAGLFGGVLEKNLSHTGFTVTTLEIPDGEEQKSLSVAGNLYHKLTKAYAERSTPILALGGGVIGDLAGFVAATYMRGVPLVQIPTTLLAQVDSSIGGKVAVNHGRLKNKIGAFYQPRLVVADIPTLQTLDAREFNNGLAEVIKSAVVWDGELFRFLETNLNKIKSRDEATLEEMVYRTASIKAEIVARDEKDLGLRHILNYGHTIGHAIESASDFRMAHGGAIAIGMVAAGRIARHLGLLTGKDLSRLQSIIQKAGLPTKLPEPHIGQIIPAMKHDKKISQGKIRFVLPQTIGQVVVTDEVDLALVEKVLVSEDA